MIKFLFSSFFIFCVAVATAQNFTGQWKGSFIDKTQTPEDWSGNQNDYVLDLEVKGSDVSGYSYTYFTDGGRKYYTICRLKGRADGKKKSIEITEVERTKTNVPVEIGNMFQVHKLNWQLQGNREVLTGIWLPAPGQRSGGYGTTLLTKRTLRDGVSVAKNSSPVMSARTAVVKKPVYKPNAAVAKNQSKPAAKAPYIAGVDTKKNPLLTASIIPQQRDSVVSQTATALSAPKNISLLPAAFEKRNNTVLETVPVDNDVIKIELYDNGEIDGDSVSIFYNEKVLVAHRRLTDKALCFNIPVENDSSNELVMYADNLGTIPPNTALLIVRDGTKRYEVRVTSDLSKSGTIRFVHKK